jgi:hypothetical protein
LFGTLVLAERRSGYIIMLLGSIMGVGVAVLHMTGSGLVGPRVVNSGRVLFWVLTLMILQVSALFSFILSVLGLWSLPWRRRTRSV